MSDNVVDFHGYTNLSISAARMLRNLSEDDGVARAVVLIERDDGSRTFHSSDTDPAWAYLMAGRFMHKMVNGDFEV
jgi:hypothetical protein